jgi:amidase
VTDDLRWLDATDQAALVRAGETSPAELVDAAIARIEAWPELNAVIVPLADEARATASNPHDLPDGPFRGVPFLLKDLGAAQAGQPQYLGNRALKAIDRRAPADTPLGARFRRAGLVTVGKANTPELGTVPTTQPLAFGPTRNPWDLTRSAAGSSGGSCAAVAAGLVPVAHANDGGGSIRLPASWCGVVGLKPTRGRMPAPEGVSRNSVELAVSRSVRDTAALLDATHGATPADLFRVEAPARPYLEELDREPGPLRVGLLTDGGGVDIDPECVTATEAAGKLLESLGHRVDVGGPEALFDGGEANNAILWVAGIARRIDVLSELAGRELGPDDVEPYNWRSAELGRAMSAADMLKAQEEQQRWVTRVAPWFDEADLLLTPATGEPPAPLAELEPPEDDPLPVGHRYGRIARFTLPFNVTGNPAVSLPLHSTADGLPVGVQLVAAMGREDLLLRVAAQLERAAPWADRRPPVPA